MFRMNLKKIVPALFILLIPVSIFVFFMYGGAIKDRLIVWQREASLPPAVSYDQIVNSNEPSVVAQPSPQEPSPTDPALPPEPPTLISLPPSINLGVPFTSQAPFANWDEVHEETCEEASLLMVARYKKGQTIDSPSDADQELLKLVDFENKIFGYYKDTTAEETARIGKEYYGFKKPRVVYEFTVDTIKRELAAGNPIIVPAAGRQLGNPYFTSPGPIYHMLVIRGYTADGKFITNDPGTRRGEGYLYKFDTVMNAIHDWNGGDVVNGKKVIIVLE